MKNLGYAVKYAFERTGASHVIKTEDDIIFKNGWYERMCGRLRKHGGVGVLSGFRYFFGKVVKCRPLGRRTEHLVEGYTGGPLMAVSRKLLGLCPQMFTNDITEMLHNDDFWINSSRESGLKVAVVQKSECQHVGVVSDFVFKPYMKGNRIVKIDHDLFPPYGMADEVVPFAGASCYHVVPEDGS
jgi:hypothetical protein